MAVSCHMDLSRHTKGKITRTPLPWTLTPTTHAAWLTLAAIAHNLLRATGCLAGPAHARARGATLRRRLIGIPARLARHGHGHITLHLPDHWRRQTAWMNAFDALHRPPSAAPA